MKNIVTPLGHGRVYRDPRTGAVLVDSDSLGRGGFADFRLLQHPVVDTQSPVRGVQLGPVRVALVEIVLVPCGRLGAVADSQHCWMGRGQAGITPISWLWPSRAI